MVLSGDEAGLLERGRLAAAGSSIRGIGPSKGWKGGPAPWRARRTGTGANAHRAGTSLREFGFKQFCSFSSSASLITHRRECAQGWDLLVAGTRLPWRRTLMVTIFLGCCADTWRK